MNVGITTLLCSLAYLLLTSTMYYSKQRVLNKENTIYICLVVTSFIGITLELMCIYFVSQLDIFPLITEIVNRGFLLYIFVWDILFSLYIFTISFNGKNSISIFVQKNKFLLFCIFAVLCLIGITLLIVLPIQYYSDGICVYSYGNATDVLYFINTLFVILWLTCLVPNIKSVGYKKYIPLFMFIVLAILNLIIREINPGILLITASQTFITIMMYFTIENPDMKIIAKLNYAKQQTEALNQVKDEFLKNMSHELMTPLNKAIGINSFNMTNEDEEVQDNAEMVDSILQDVTEISRNIIDTINLQTGLLKLNNKVYDPKDVFDKVIKLKIEKAKNKNIKLELKIKGKLPTALYGDDTKIKQVLMNIVDNAIKYTNKGNVKIVVKNELEANNCMLIINVKDTGIGISPSNVRKLFKEFGRIEVDKNITTPGMGLGLSISKQILDLMNGTIEVNSKENIGSEFIIKVNQELIKKDVIESNE